MTLLSITDMLWENVVPRVVPYYSELRVLFGLGIILMFMMIARMVTRDWRIIVLAGVVGFLLAFGYIPT